MIDPQKYIKNGRVDRAKIVSDIQCRNISLKELQRLIQDPMVSSGFFGDGYQGQVPKEQWTEQYLSQLTCAAIADCFNPEYLYYLNEVAEYVNSVRGKIKSIRIKIAKRKQEDKSKNSKLLQVLHVLVNIIEKIIEYIKKNVKIVLIVFCVVAITVIVLRLFLSILNS